MVVVPPKYNHVSLADLGPDCDLNLWIRAGRVTYLANLPRLYIRKKLPDSTWSNSPNYCWLRFNSDSHARAAEAKLHCCSFEGRLLQAITAVREPRLPLHPGLSLPSDATLADPDPQPKKALDSRTAKVATSTGVLSQLAKGSKQNSSDMAESQPAQRPMGLTSGNVVHQRTPRPDKPSLGAVVTQRAPTPASPAYTGAVEIKNEKEPIYTHKFYQENETPVHWTERQPRHGVHIDVQRIPPEFHDGRIVRRDQMDRFLRLQEVVSCDVIWPEEDEGNLLNFHCWLDFSAGHVKKIMILKLQRFIFILGQAYKFQDSAAPAIRAEHEVSLVVSNANNTSAIYTHLDESRYPLFERKRSTELGLVVYLSKFPRTNCRGRFSRFLRGVGVAPCKLFWPHPVSKSEWNSQCWLEFSEPSHAAAAAKILTGAPFWYHLKPILNGAIDPVAPIDVTRGTHDAHSASVDYLVEETADAANPAHSEQATYTHDICYNPQTSSADIEHWIQLGLLIHVWGFAKFDPHQFYMRYRRKRLEKVIQNKGVAPCNIIWPHHGLCDLLWLKFSNPDHAAAAISILNGARFRGGVFSAFLGDCPRFCTSTAAQDGEAGSDGEERRGLQVTAQEEGCASVATRQS